MNKDYRLLDEALQALKGTRAWLSADYYRTNINPVVVKIQERLASLEADKFVTEKNNQYYKTSNSKKEEIERKIKRINSYEPNTVPDKLENSPTANILDNSFDKESDTIPSKLIEATTNFGLFNNIKGEHCKTHTDAPHRYLKELSESMGRYVCQCEFWSPEGK